MYYVTNFVTLDTVLKKPAQSSLIFVHLGHELFTVRFTKSGSVLQLYKISILLKTGGAGVLIITHKINIGIKTAIERFDR